MNQDDQGDINCPYCEYAIRVSELPKNNKIRCPGCKKTIDDVQSRLIPLASAINSLPDKKTDKPEIIVENLIQENTVDKNELTQKQDLSLEGSKSNNSEPENFENFKSTEDLEYDEEFVKKQAELAQEFAISQSKILNWEENADEVSSGKRSNRIIFTLIALIVTSLVVFISFKGITKNNAAMKGIEIFFESKTPEKENSSIPKTKTFDDLLKQMESLGLHELVSASLEEFLNSDDIEAKIKLSRSSERVIPLMRKYYQNYDDGPIAFRRISSAGEKGTGIIDGFYLIKVSFPDFSILPVILAYENDRIVVDWESFVGYSEITLSEFISKKPRNSTLMRLNASSDNYFNYQFQEDMYRCLYLRNPEDTEAVYGYIERGGRADDQLSRIIESGQSIRFLTLKIQYPKKLGGKNQVIIDEIVTSGWLIKE
tara:strand:+ start:4421 stop:5704 length:1284 start_codon:yes stop_codon:yes gene_type:complete